MSIQDPINQVSMDFETKGEKCSKVEVPVVFISPALPDNIVQELAQLFHVAGHAMQHGIELTTAYVQLDADNNHALLDMAGAPDRRAMSLFGAQHAMANDMIVNIAMGEAWTAPPEVLAELMEQELPEDFKLSNHPEAFECITVQVETLNGIWSGKIRVSPFTGTAETADTEEVAGEPRKYVGVLELVKMDDITEALYPPVLPEHMEALLVNSSLPEVMKQIARVVMDEKLKERKERLEAKANGEQAAADVAADAIEKASASAK